MQWVSLLFVWLLAVQIASAIRPAAPPNKQWVQLTVAFKGVTCADTPKGASLLRIGARDSVKAYFQAKGYSQTIIDSTAGVLEPECVDSSDSRTTYASFRTSVSFSGLPTSADRDFLFKSFRQGSCRGGYDTEVYGVLADAIAAAGLKVAKNKAGRNNPFSRRGWIEFVTPENCRNTPAPGSPSPNPSSTSPEPGTSTSPEPGTSTSPDPGTSTSPEPGTSTSPEPGTSTSPDPGTSTSPEPGTSTSPEPGTSTSPDPGTSTSPDPGTSTSPDPATSTSPDPGTSTSPDPGTSTSPDPGTSTSPDPGTSTSPDPETSPSPAP